MRTSIGWQPLMFIAAAATLCTATAFAGDQVNDAEVRQSIKKSLPFLIDKGQQWIDQRKCVSCHQVPFMVWSLNAASQHGFEVDPQKLDEWNRWATDWKSFVAAAQRKDAVRAKTLTQNVDTTAELLLAFRHYPDALKAKRARFEEFREHLSKNQTDDGSWDPCGQLPRQRRPARETREVTTMWTLLALGEVDAKSKAKATQWLSGSDQVGQTTEWWAAKLLLARQWGEQDKAALLRKQLLDRQNEDGGWPWMEGEASDGFGTGVALFALKDADRPSEAAAIQSARRFLVRAQTDEGSWEVKDTRKGKKDRVSPTATYWGSAWAVIGLLQTID